MSKGTKPILPNAPAKNGGRSGGNRGNNPTAPGKTPPPAPKKKKWMRRTPRKRGS